MTDDLLDEMIDERTMANPAFPSVLDVAIRRRQIAAERVADGVRKPK